MATVTLAYVQSYRDRYGKRRHYYRRRGKRVALPGLPGEPQFMRAYEEAAARFSEPQSATSKAVAAGSFDALCISTFVVPSFRTSARRASGHIAGSLIAGVLSMERSASSIWSVGTSKSTSRPLAK